MSVDQLMNGFAAPKGSSGLSGPPSNELPGRSQSDYASKLDRILERMDQFSNMRDSISALRSDMNRVLERLELAPQAPEPLHSQKRELNSQCAAASTIRFDRQYLISNLTSAPCRLQHSYHVSRTRACIADFEFATQGLKA